jgi:hypothetical protein
VSQLLARIQARLINSLGNLNRSTARIPFISLLGLYKNDPSSCLVLIQSAAQVAQYASVQRVDRVEIVPLSSDPDSHNFRAILGKGFRQCPMYFSPLCDLSLSHASALSGEATRDDFIWNFSAISNLKAVWPDVPVRPVVAGVVSEVAPFTLISRRSRFNPGIHIWNRGADADGHPANFFETEMIWREGDRCVSFVQLRGSVPTFWTQYPTGQISRPVAFGSDAESERRARLHFRDLHSRYSNGLIVLALTDDLERFATASNIGFRYLPFHALFKKPGGLEGRIAELDLALEFTETRGQEIVVRQTKFIRSSCMSSLDRTGAVQALLSASIFSKFTAITVAHWKVWRANADQLAKIYVCAGGQKVTIPSRGYQTPGAEWVDRWNRGVRFYKSLFVEGEMDDAYAAVTRLAPTSSCSSFTSSPSSEFSSYS